MGDAAGMEGSSLAKIFVGGLDRSVDEGVVRNFFSQFGPVLEVCTNRIFIFFHKSVCSLPPMFSSEQELTI
jgi:RNA recognition motif-containing protein